MPHARLPLTSRPLDLLYFLFFLVHIPGTLLIDIQTLYPREYVPEPLKNLITSYLQWTADPLLSASFDLNAMPTAWVWFKSFLVLELVFQVPVFFIGLRALWTDSRASYPLLLIYSASSATTTLACISTILRTPLSSTPYPASLLDPFSSQLRKSSSNTLISITLDQRTLLLAGYLPFLVVPLLMCIDMAIRVAGLVTAGIRAEGRDKRAVKNE